MSAYLLLFGITVVLGLGSMLILRKTRQWSFLMGMCIIYFWTFLGSWFFIGDAMSGYKGYKIGLAYYYLMEKMFPFELDRCYMIALLGYGLFSIALLAGVFLMVRRKKVVPRSAPMVLLDHRVFLLLALITGIVSFLIVRPLMMQAIEHQESIYLVTRTTYFAGSTIHALCNELGAFSILLGWSLYLTSGNPRYFASAQTSWIGYAYPLLLLVFAMYLMLLGNKHELFMGLVLGILVFFVNSIRPAYGKLLVYAGLCALPLFITGKIREYSLQDLGSDNVEQPSLQGAFTVPIIANVPRKPEATGPVMHLGQLFFSNELFAAHFSLYGICRMHVHPVPGVSARYLASSLIPRLLKEDRPPTAYDAYAAQAGLMPGQGYTIHQAAGWYMNGGWPMVAIGGLFFGLIWGLLMRWNGNPPSGSLAVRVLSIMGTSCWVAYLPMLIRDGPETMKALVFEGFGLPIGVVLLAAFIAKRSSGPQNLEHGS